jgi:hypothetical protein
VQPIPSFLDFEASSLRPNSYPIEVAWNTADGSVESHLISPAGNPEWFDWDPESETVHGIPRTELLDHGEPPSSVCDFITQRLTAEVVYTDAPDYEAKWLRELFTASRKPLPPFNLRHVDQLLIQMICPDEDARPYGLIKIGWLKQQARQQCTRRHRAAWDVEYLIQLWRLAAGEAPIQSQPPEQVRSNKKRKR